MRNQLTCVVKFFVFARPGVPDAPLTSVLDHGRMELLFEGPSGSDIEETESIVRLLRAQLSARLLCDGTMTILGPTYADDCEWPYKLAVCTDKTVVAFAFYKADPTTKSLRRWLRRLCTSVAKGARTPKAPAALPTDGTRPAEPTTTTPPRAPDESNVGGGYDWPGGR